jgi:hypothetical protein
MMQLLLELICRSFAHSYDDKPYSQRAAAKDGGEVEMYSPLTR